SFEVGDGEGPCDPQPQRLTLAQFEILGKSIPIVGDFNDNIVAADARVDLDLPPLAAAHSVFDRVGRAFIDQQRQDRRLPGRDLDAAGLDQEGDSHVRWYDVDARLVGDLFGDRRDSRRGDIVAG